MRNEYDAELLDVIAVSAEPEVMVRAYAEGQGLNHPVLADAADLRDAYGVDVIWGLPTFLIDAEGRIVAEGIDSVERRVREVLGGR